MTGISTATALATFAGHTCALLADHTVRCWGLNDFGQLGDGTTTMRLTPVAVTGISTATAIATVRPHVRAARRPHCPLLGQERGRPARRWHDGRIGPRRSR